MSENSYEIITNTVLGWAKQNENIRAVILIGSRARTSEKADKWSDLDLLVIAEDILEYTAIIQLLLNIHYKHAKMPYSARNKLIPSISVYSINALK